MSFLFSFFFLLSCARNELSSNFKGSVVAGGCHRGSRHRAPPHGESKPLLKCSWNRFLPTRGGDPSPEGARKPSEIVSYRSRLEMSVQQKRRRPKRTGLCESFLVLRVPPAGIRPDPGPVPARFWHGGPITVTFLPDPVRFN